jgi:AraC-like DNA-binding protein
MDQETRNARRQRDSQVEPGDYRVRVGGVSNIPSLLRSFGCDPDRVLKSAGFSLEQISDMDSTISFLAGSKLLARCVEATACPHFGLLLGQSIRPYHLGIAGFLVVTSTHVAAALESLAAYMDLHDRSGTATVVPSEDSMMLGYSIHQAEVHRPDQIYDMTMAFACGLMRQLCGPDWTPTEVLLAHAPPREVKPYTHYFRAPVRFNAEESCLVFPSKWLLHKPPLSDPNLHGYLEREARQIQAESNRSIVLQLHSALKQCIAMQHFTKAAVAQRLGMHERTLHRRLHAKGTNFRRELDRIRRGMSEQLLSVTTMEIWKIATVVGYSSTSAFNHAFRRWHDMSPEHWRQTARG